MNELRDFDNKTIVVYSDEKPIITKISGWRECFKAIAYVQDQKYKPVIVGWDLYLPKMKRITNGLAKLGISCS